MLRQSTSINKGLQLKPTKRLPAILQLAPGHKVVELSTLVSPIALSIATGTKGTPHDRLVAMNDGKVATFFYIDQA